jgi:uncharacterized protein (TIGR02453 family)
MSTGGDSDLGEESIAFLQGLEANNTRAWFDDNREFYERALKRPAERFSARMTERLAALTGTPHGAKIFRIHRDVRFSKDKTPYNPHLHIAFFRDGGSPRGPSWFFGLHPDHLVLGAGVMAFDGRALDRYRARVAGPHGAALAKVLAGHEREGARISGPDLKRVPAGFDARHPRADLLRRKGLAVWIDRPDPRLATGPEAAERCVDVFMRLRPVHDWLAETGF